MMRFTNSNTFSYGVRISLKIGVHHGNCTYGVIGYHKPQFSLIGDTVNTTSRHCTTGDSGCIVLSMAAKARINSKKYHWAETRNVEMKGKGTVEVFMIPTRKQNSVPDSNAKEDLKKVAASQSGLRTGVKVNQDCNMQNYLVSPPSLPMNLRSSIMGLRDKKVSNIKKEEKLLNQDDNRKDASVLAVRPNR